MSNTNKTLVVLCVFEFILIVALAVKWYRAESTKYATGVKLSVEGGKDANGSKAGFKFEIQKDL